MITFQPERIGDVREEVWPLLLRHWDEIALNKEHVPLNPDWEGYQRLDDAGMLHVTTARSDGEIVGYSSYLMVPNLHYRTMLVADCDIFYLAPEHRRGMTGIQLLRAAERHILAFAQTTERKYDCVYILAKEKCHFLKDGRPVVGPVLERIGFKMIEHHYAKRVEIV